MHLVRSMGMFGLLTATLSAPSLAFGQVNVVASIKPIHSLVASVMEGVGTPDLVVQGAGSPHTFTLRPSTARKIADADVVFWVGPGMENFLETPLSNLAPSAKIVSLKDAEGLKLLSFREGGDFEAHEHGGDQHHDEHEAHDEHEHASASHDDEEHDAQAFDMHLWLDPQNAVVMLDEIAKTLSKADPENAAKYAANAQAEEARINKLSKSLKVELENNHDKPFVVFHDAYRYFEEAYDLNAVGSVTVSPEVLPGARRLSQVRQKLESLGASCVFSEAQFNPKMVAVLKEGTGVKTAELDPLGSNLQAGPQLYTDLLKQMGRTINECLSDNQ
nr:zinc ABC transporter substrate-binding protein [Pseudovibrio axinellae]